MLAAAATTSSALQSGDFTYTTDGVSITITDYNGSGGTVHIPTMVDDKPVTGIGEGVFFYKTSLTSVIIPESVTAIGNYAFYFTSLTSVTIPDSVASIGDNAFDSCFNLTRATIGDSVTAIGNYAFYGTGLTSVTIPGSVIIIGDNAFDSCSNLTGVYFKGNAPTLSSYVFSGTPTTIYHMSEATGWTNPWGDRATVLWNPAIQLDDASFGLLAGEFGFNVAETESGLVIIEACTNLSNDIWIPLNTNSMSNNCFYFSDPDSKNNRHRFYRLSMP